MPTGSDKSTPIGQSRRVAKGLATLVIIIATCAVHRWLLYEQVQVLRGNGELFETFEWSMLYLLAMALLCLIVLPLGVFLTLRGSKTRLVGVLLLFGCVAHIAASAYYQRMATEYRMDVFRALGHRSMPLINAIKTYESRLGHPPSDLEELVPEYMEKIPATGMNAYPEFDYLVGEDAAMWFDNPWVVRVYASRGPLNFDQFLYFPNQQYPEQYAGNRFQRLGAWAYYHE